MDIVLIAEGIGALALLVLIYSYQGKNRENILIRQLWSSVFFLFHFALLSAWTGVLMNAIVVVRNFVFAQKEKRAWAKSLAWVFFFIALSVGALFLTWEGPVSLLPAAAVIIGIYARWQEKASQIRVLGIVGACLWLPYTIIVHSYAGTLTQLVLIAGILFGMFRHDRKPVSAPAP